MPVKMGYVSYKIYILLEKTQRNKQVPRWKRKKMRNWLDRQRTRLLGSALAACLDPLDRYWNSAVSSVPWSNSVLQYIIDEAATPECLSLRSKFIYCFSTSRVNGLMVIPFGNSRSRTCFIKNKWSLNSSS